MGKRDPSLHCGVREVVLEERALKLRCKEQEGFNQVEVRRWMIFTKARGKVSVIRESGVYLKI